MSLRATASFCHHDYPDCALSSLTTLVINLITMVRAAPDFLIGWKNEEYALFFD
jgi:hypothetical protein